MPKSILIVEAEDGQHALTKLDGRKYHLVISGHRNC